MLSDSLFASPPPKPGLATHAARAFPQLSRVPGQLPACLPSDHERNQQFADSVPFEIEGERYARPFAVIQRFNRAVGNPVTGMPPTLRKPQLFGGHSSATTSVVGTSRRPTRRVTTVLDPTASGASLSGLAETTLSCHSGKCVASVAYEKTSSGRRNISMLSTIGPMPPPSSRSCAVLDWPFGHVLAHGPRQAPPGPKPCSR